MDVVYTLLLDETGSGRQEARKRIDPVLERPMDPEAADQYDRERWGLDDEAIAAAAKKDAMFGAVSYE